ncbi:hypothetical protein ACIO3O_32100 [Streptomyces sp. NPDC087440]|uniref:hypothetical protein n=1 Tax=Streptomyces sp. NPDC087440 TaxID=3365790 RepID=UPI003808B908
MSQIQSEVQGEVPAARSRRRSRYFVVPAVLLALGGGAVGAHRLLTDRPATDNGEIQCFPTASLRGPSAWTDSLPEGEDWYPMGPRVTARIALNTCARLWEADLMSPEEGDATKGRKQPIIIPTATPGRGKSPALAACVLGDGQAAVFPGDDRTTCQNLGLARLADRE